MLRWAYVEKMSIRTLFHPRPSRFEPFSAKNKEQPQSYSFIFTGGGQDPIGTAIFKYLYIPDTYKKIKLKLA